MKQLIFEGAGWAGSDTSKATDVSNCRIRTRIRNNIGRVIYLEMGATIYGKTKPNFAERFFATTWITDCFYEDASWDKSRCFSRELSSLQEQHFEYNKANILQFVNNRLDCSFDNLEILNEGLYVFATEEPICDSSNGKYEPYQDQQYNINQLDGMEPIYTCDNRLSDYRIGYDSLITLPYMKKEFEHFDKQTLDKSKNGGTARFRFDNKGVITSVELNTGVWFRMSVGIEEVEEIINLIKQDHRLKLVRI